MQLSARSHEPVATTLADDRALDGSERQDGTIWLSVDVGEQSLELELELSPDGSGFDSARITQRWNEAADAWEIVPGDDHVSPTSALWTWLERDPQVGKLVRHRWTEWCDETRVWAQEA